MADIPADMPTVSAKQVKFQSSQVLDTNVEGRGPEAALQTRPAQKVSAGRVGNSTVTHAA